MAVYKYRAKKGPQEIAEGRIEALSEKEAIEKVNAMGFVPLRIQEEEICSRSVDTFEKKPIGRIRPSEITIFTRQLASLLRSGMPILSSLNIISEQSQNPHLKFLLKDIHDAIKEGATFSSSLAKFPKAFPSLYIAMARSGEDSGALPAVLVKIADYRTKQEELFSRFRMALAYPILMAIVGVATVVFMLTFVIPRLMRIFINLGQNLPLPTRILISVSSFLRHWWFWVIILMAVLIIRRELRTKTGRLSFSIFKLHLPILGKFILKTELARFSRTLELLIKNGIPILKGIDIAIPVIDNELLKSQLKQSCKELEQGGSFGRSLKNSRLIPSFMSNLIIVGEESGKLDETLAEVASSYERDTEEATRIMSSLLEPLMILVMGLIVGFMVMAMLLPIFEINVLAR